MHLIPRKPINPTLNDGANKGNVAFTNSMHITNLELGFHFYYHTSLFYYKLQMSINHF